MNNKGASILFVTLIMFVIFAFTVVIMNMGLNEIKLTNVANDKSKAYYMAEGGIYYAGSVIYDAVYSSVEPASQITVNSPFDEYKKDHEFIIDIVKQSERVYKVTSQGNYNGQVQKVQSVVSIGFNNIIYTQMKKIS